MDIIQRNGEAWQRQADGSWLRFDIAAGMWLPSAVAPPPPPPPPPATADPYFALPKPKGGPFGLPDLRGLVGGLDRRIALVGLALLVGLFGIGGAALLGGDSTSPAAALGSDRKLSKKAQFIYDADVVCADLVKVGSKLQTPTDMAQVIEGLRTVRDEVYESYRALRALKPPSNVRKEWKRYLGNPSDLLIFDRMLAAAERGDLVTLQSLNQQLQAMSGKGDRWAKRYGFKVCSQDAFEA